MARRLVEPEDVYSAANDIKSRGEQPSALTIYDEIGRGSLTTISKFFKEWLAKEDNQQTQALPAEIVVPQDLQAMSNKWIKTLWNSAISLAEMDFEDRRAAVNAESEKLAEQLKESELFSERQNEKLETAQDEAEQLKEQLRESSLVITAKDREIEALESVQTSQKEEISVLRAEQQKDAGHLRDLKGLNEEVTEKANNLDHANRQLIDEKTRLSESEAAMSKVLSELRSQVTELTSEKSALLETKASLQARTESVEKQLKGIESKLESAEKRNENLQSDLVEIAKKAAEKGDDNEKPKK